MKNVGFTLSNVPYTLKFVSSVQRQDLFKRKSLPISSTLWGTFSFEELMYVRSAIFCLLLRLKVLCHSFPLHRPLHGDPNFFKINSKIKGKCSLKAVFFKRKLRRIPSIKIYKNRQRTLLKEKPFE